MPDRTLVLIAGAQRRRAAAKAAQERDAIAKRWRADGAGAWGIGGGGVAASSTPDERDVIPLLDGWIRRLEREAAGGETP